MRVQVLVPEQAPPQLVKVYPEEGEVVRVVVLFSGKYLVENSGAPFAFTIPDPVIDDNVSV